jgi:hypothetical protein
VRRLTAWIGGAAGGFVAYRLLRRRRPQVAPEPSTEPGATEPDARAEELRAKLDESREVEPEPTIEPVVEDPSAEEPERESPEDRRRRVHDEGRAALDDMKSE